MRRIQYLVRLESEQERIRVDFGTDRGEVVALHAVQYETFVQDGWWPVARCDASHGFFHLDLVTPRGTMKYRVLIGDLAQALTFAIDDLKEHWRRYRRQALGEV